MANRGIHLTGATYAKPSVFEISSQESLASILEPAIKKILDFIATSKHERYGWILEWSDEFYAVFNGILQAFFINKYCKYN